MLIKYVCKVKKILDFLSVDANFDEEEFAESEQKIKKIHQESDLENDEQEIKNVDNEISSPPQDENLCGSTNTD